MLNLRRNILIFHQAALGDFIVTFPIALAMGRMFPQSRVMYVTADSKGRLAEKLLGVDRIDIESGWHVLHGTDPELNDRNRTLLAGAHTIISFVSTPNDLWEDNVRALNPQATLIQLDTKSADDGADDGAEAAGENHVTASLIRQMNRWPVLSAAGGQMLSSVRARGLNIRRMPVDLVIHPGAGSPQKRWPMENFVKLAQSLHRANVSVRVLLGEAESGEFSTVDVRALRDIATLHTPATYLELLENLTHAKVFIGNDSGPGHLAGIIGVPVISLFGMRSVRWKPIGPAVHVIEKESLAKISVDEVLQMTHRLMESPAEVSIGSADDDD